MIISQGRFEWHPASGLVRRLKSGVNEVAWRVVREPGAKGTLEEAKTPKGVRRTFHTYEKAQAFADKLNASTGIEVLTSADGNSVPYIHLQTSKGVLDLIAGSHSLTADEQASALKVIAEVLAAHLNVETLSVK